jgi:AcrR family transcriptional regulator
MSDDAPVPSGLRARKKAMARRSILAVADGLFAAKGYDQVTVSEIADAANVSVKTLFTYFRSKEDLAFQDTRLIDAVVGAIQTRARLLTPAQAAAEKLLQLIAEGGGEGLAAYLRGYGNGPAVQSRLLRLWLEYEDRIAAELAREAKQPAPGPDARFQAAQIVLLIRACTWPELGDLAQHRQGLVVLEKWLKMTAWRLE